MEEIIDLDLWEERKRQIEQQREEKIRRMKQSQEEVERQKLFWSHWGFE
ncbi:MAG: hypothetical protein QXL17_02600 [Candidatus Thermoplasmatota archaeon]